MKKLANVRLRLVFKDWYKLVFPFNRFFLERVWLTTRHPRLTFLTRGTSGSDWIIVGDVVSRDEYCLRRLPLPENAVVVDLGAHIGSFSKSIKYYNPSADVTCYEPSHSGFQCLKSNVPFATLVNKAAGGKRGIALFSEEGGAAGWKLSEKGTVEVETIPLDEILAPFSQVDLLKVDIEGAERELLENASETTLQKVQRIFMETHNCNEWGEAFLATHGFKTKWLWVKSDTLGVIYGWR